MTGLAAPAFAIAGVADLAQVQDAAAALRTEPNRGTARLTGAGAADTAAALLGLDGWASRVELVPADLVEPLTSQTEETDGTRWVLFSSGTTGAPKPVAHPLASLTRSVRAEDGPRTWGLVFDPMRLAGLSVLLQSMATGSTLVEARAGTVPERLRTLRDHGVTALSATPTFWRQVLTSPLAAGWPLDRITLGGEVADQRLLDALRARFPDAAIAHVFASSETASAFSVTDGLAGFPAAYLDRAPGGITLAVRDGELWVHSPTSSAAGADGYAPTGDVVEVRDGRVLFAGRSSGAVNVGGTKVFPEQVEAALREHPEVRDAVVTGRPNPFSGHVLVASVTGEVDGPELRRWAAARLPAAMVPATIAVVPELGVTGAGKAVRA